MKRELVFVMALLAAGCASNKPSIPVADPANQPQVHELHGKVVRVNENDGYVVLECTFLPSTGEELTVFRDRDRQIRSRVRVGSVSSGRWVVADIIEGRPMPGDWFIGR